MLDTNIFSFLFKDSQEAEAYFPHLTGRLCLSFITIGELYFWAEKRDWGAARRRRLEQRLENFVILGYDRDVAIAFGRSRAHLERKGKKAGIDDLWIAATALAFDCELVTHNPRHFQAIPGLKIISECR